jgi:hypothetical protein
MNLSEVTINYFLLSQAISYYTELGYEYVEVPWNVSKVASNLTCQNDSYIFCLDDGSTMVGSAEQSFIELLRHTDRITHLKKYMTVTPCFRREQDDETHCEQFIKLELFISAGTTFAANVDQANDYFSKIDYDANLMGDAYECYKFLGLESENIFTSTIEMNDPNQPVDPQKVLTLESSDILYKRSGDDYLELGSYGYRRFIIPKMDGNIYHEYQYGTGIALPRFQLVY